MLTPISCRHLAQRKIFSSCFQARFAVEKCGKRRAHTDIKVPDFTHVMRPSCANPRTPASHTDIPRKLVPYMIGGTAITVGMYLTKYNVYGLVKFMDASADVLALAKIEIKMDEIPEGKHVTFKWRGKPLFVWHRTDHDVEEVRKVPLSILRDPQNDADRVKDPNWLIVLGVCTHLGCVPMPHSGDFGGYYCPCHGSHFDASGRCRKGPAPTNLVVPEYVINGNILVVG